MEADEIITLFKNYIEFDVDTKSLLLQNKGYIEIDFGKLSKFSSELGEELLDNPTETIKGAEIAFLDIIDGNSNRIQIMFKNLSQAVKTPLNTISNQLNKLLSFEGYIIKPTEIYLQCVSAKYSCPSLWK